MTCFRSTSGITSRATVFQRRFRIYVFSHRFRCQSVSLVPAGFAERSPSEAVSPAGRTFDAALQSAGHGSPAAPSQLASACPCGGGTRAR